MSENALIKGNATEEITGNIKYKTFLIYQIYLYFTAFTSTDWDGFNSIS